ncbi:hypothetical protein [uncultured Roseibium sp.]|uniref:hypothetical protein n=1 Tax=uncultured Roseibium sp. TaxID=1936171 RepID=UPI0032163C39
MIPLERKIRIQQNLVANWKGDVVDVEERLIRVFNRNGTRPPLIWCFNAEHEPEAVAKALGPDQPLIAMRSLHITVDFRNKLISEDAEIARHYVKGLLKFLDFSRCWVGGNCQGAAVAAEIANLLVLEGKDVQGLFAMEWSPVMPFPKRCVLIFGDESHEHNPFLRGDDPWPQWRHMFAGAICEIIPGRHGSYFKADKVGGLAAVLQAEMSKEAKTLPLPAEAGLVWSKALCEPVYVNQMIRIEVRPPDQWRSENHIYAVWVPLMPRCAVKTSLVDVDVSQDCCSVSLPTPPEPGNWTLQMFLCDAEQGPLNWENDFQQVWTGEILDHNESAMDGASEIATMRPM